MPFVTYYAPSALVAARVEDHTPTVTAAASFQSRTTCGNAETRRRRGDHTCTKVGTFRNRVRDGQVVGLGGVGEKVPTSHEDPFGNTIRLTGTGTIAKDNPFRFSTKRAEDNTGLVLYEYRAYSPSLGRWVSRDPLSEKGGKNLLVFARNNPVSLVDFLGLLCSSNLRVPEDIMQILQRAWGRTLDSGREQGGNIYRQSQTDMYGDIAARPGSNDEISIPFDPQAAARYHTHPPYNGVYGNPPSTEDSTRAALQLKKKGNCHYIHTGTFIYAICVGDTKACTACNDIQKLIELADAAQRRVSQYRSESLEAGQTIEEAHVRSLERVALDIASECGLCVYKSTPQDPTSHRYGLSGADYWSLLK